MVLLNSVHGSDRFISKLWFLVLVWFFLFLVRFWFLPLLLFKRDGFEQDIIYTTFPLKRKMAENLAMKKKHGSSSGSSTQRSMA